MLGGCSIMYRSVLLVSGMGQRYGCATISDTRGYTALEVGADGGGEMHLRPPWLAHGRWLTRCYD